MKPRLSLKEKSVTIFRWDSAAEKLSFYLINSSNDSSIQILNGSENHYQIVLQAELLEMWYFKGKFLEVAVAGRCNSHVTSENKINIK